MNNQLSNLQTEKKYDLEERTAKFAEKIIDLVRGLPESSVNKRMVEQIVGSGGSLGANYCEANEAEIRLLAHANPNFKEDFRGLWKEAEELLLIFSAIIRKSKSPKV